jgi:hypothetical protein
MMSEKLIKIKFIEKRRFIPEGYIGSYPEEQARKLINDGKAIELKMLDKVEQEIVLSEDAQETEEGEE